MKDAMRAADEIAEAVKPMLSVMPEMVDAFGSMPLFARVRFQRWDELLAVPPPAGKLDDHCRAAALRAGARLRRLRASMRMP